MTIDAFEEICRRLPYRRKGMFFSEAFIFLQACERNNIQTIVESGVKFGMSTALIRAAWDGELISIDKDEEALREPIEGVDFMLGDSCQLIPAILAESVGRRIAVLIDGPKGFLALRLKDSCLAAPNCFVVGVHDVGVGLGERSHSHNPQFVWTRERLDALVPESWRRKYPIGPGLGIWEKP